MKKALVGEQSACEAEREKMEAVFQRTLRAQVKNEIYTYGVGFRRLALFLIRERHPEIDLSGIDFLFLRGAEVPNKDDGKEEDNEPIEPKVLVGDQGNAGDGIHAVNPDNPSGGAIPTVIQTVPVVSEATAVSAEITTIVASEVVSDVLVPVEYAKNVSKSSNVIIDPPPIGDE